MLVWAAFSAQFLTRKARRAEVEQWREHPSQGAAGAVLQLKSAKQPKAASARSVRAVALVSIFAPMMRRDGPRVADATASPFAVARHSEREQSSF